MLRKFSLLSIFVCSALFAIDFTSYHTEDQINQYLKDMTQQNPALVKFYTLGYSDQNREIDYITLTKGNEQLPAIFFNGTHHGNEWSATEGILGLIDYLLTHKDDADVSALLTQYVFYLEPMVNPDGHHNQTREDINGADPNRDYDYPGAAAGSQFKTKIISVMRKLIDSRKFRAAAAYHSGIEEVLYSWCYTSDPTKDNDLLYTFAKTAATAMGMNRYLQSYDDYETEGEFIDYAYMTQGTFALTYEVSSAYTPDVSELPAVVTRSIDGAMAFIKAVSQYDNGQLNVEPAPNFTSLVSRHSAKWDFLGSKLE
jgi:predicted deacylase